MKAADITFDVFQVKYKEKYEREKGKAMLDFETPTYVTAKEAQHMQSQVNTLSVTSVFHLLTTFLHRPLSEGSSAPAYTLTCDVLPLVIYIC